MGWEAVAAIHCEATAAYCGDPMTLNKLQLQTALLITWTVGTASGVAPSSNLSCKNWQDYQRAITSKSQSLKLSSKAEGTAEESFEDEKLPSRYDQLIVSKSNRGLIAFQNNKAIKHYSVSIGQNPKGAKSQDGDLKTPEGQYYIQAKNPRSKYYLSLLISYPAPKDIELAEKLNVRPGDSIMLHGFPLDPAEREFAQSRHTSSRDWTQGCVAVSDDEIAEIYSRVQLETPILICP